MNNKSILTNIKFLYCLGVEYARVKFPITLLSQGTYLYSLQIVMPISNTKYNTVGLFYYYFFFAFTFSQLLILLDLIKQFK